MMRRKATKKFTVAPKRVDGFGSQILRMLICYLITECKESTYCHSDIKTIQLLHGGKKNKDITVINRTLDIMMKKLGIQRSTPRTPGIKYPYKIFKKGFFKKNLLKKLQKAWPLSNPYDKKVLSIHIRRGDDIQVDTPARWVSSEYYNNLIDKCLNIFPDHTIQIVCWGDPGISEKLKSAISIEADNSGDDILKHFNMLVQSDILIVGSSSFSVAAGILNKNQVLIDKNMFKLSCPYPDQWSDNFKKTFKSVF